MLTEIKIALGLWGSAESAGTLFATKHCSGGSKVAIDACSSWIELFYFAEAWHGRSISVARNVMFSGKQTTARKIADQLRTVLIKEHIGFTATAFILRAQYELLTL